MLSEIDPINNKQQVNRKPLLGDLIEQNKKKNAFSFSDDIEK